MSLRTQTLFWFAVLLCLMALLFVFREILLPFIAGAALAYLLDPLVDRLEGLKIGRSVASLIALAGFLCLGIVIVLAVIPVFLKQIEVLLQILPDLMQRARSVVETISSLVGQTPDHNAAGLALLRDNVGNFASRLLSWTGNVLVSLWSGGQALVSLLSLIVITPIVAFYLLVDWDRIIASIDDWLPRDHRDTIRALVVQMDDVVAGFVRGQALVCVILGSFYAICLMLVGLDFGLLIGLTVGVIGFIPYVGSVLGLVLSAGLALFQFLPQWQPVLLVLAVFLIGQFVEGNILQPRMIGARVSLHPVWLMFALFAFGSLMGFVGLLIAVPAAASIGVLARFALQQYRTGALYRGVRTVRPDS